MKPTAFQIAEDAINSQRPIDRTFLRRVYNSFDNERDRRLWAKGCLEASLLYNPNTLSRQMIARAVTCFLEQIKLEF